MNLSDLVHRTAGDNKVLTTTTVTATAATANGSTQQPQINNSSNLFQQSTSLSNTNNNSNVFSNSTRQDPSFLFTMPNVNQADWMNNNLFFNNATDDLIEPISVNTTNTIPSNNNHSNLDASSYMKQDLTFNNSFLNQPLPQQQHSKPISITKTSQQKPYQPPAIAPYPAQTVFNSKRFDIPSNVNAATKTPPEAATYSPKVSTSNKQALPMNNNFSSQATTVTALSSQVSPIMHLSKQASPITIHKQASPMSKLDKSPNTANTITALDNHTSPITAATTIINNHITTPNSISSPTKYNNLQFNDIVHSSPASTSTSLSPPPPPVVKKPPKVDVPKLTIRGENVNSRNIEEGYIQFVLNHDSNYIGDGIESLIHAKRKFSSVPKTGDISYSTWDIYELVLKMDRGEIKNWSQLVGQLGLSDMAGRPQFAQRVKRWMHRYKIDCYFDYLLGNKFDFHAPTEKYSGCLMMGNYKKKGTAEENALKKRDSEWDEDGFDPSSSSQMNVYKVPVLLAGSRKRMRDHSQNSQQMIENARQFLKTNHSEESDEEDAEESPVAMDTDDDSDEEDNEPKMNIEAKNSEEKESGDDDEDDNNDEEEEEEDEEEEEEEEEEDEVDEEDELVSMSSSHGSPVVTYSKLNCSPKLVSISPSSVVKKVSPVLPTVFTSPVPCVNCPKHETTISKLEKEITQLKSYITTLESTVEQQGTVTAQMNKLLRLKDRTEKWRKQLIEDLARGPMMISDDDDVDDDIDEDETTDGDT